MLEPSARRRYARHLLLAEIGEAGQERLLGGRFRLAAEAGRAEQLAADYLRRAGMQSDPDGQPLLLGSVRAPDELQMAAEALRGAFAAVEAIKACLGVGTPARLDTTIGRPEEDCP